MWTSRVFIAWLLLLAGTAPQTGALLGAQCAQPDDGTTEGSAASDPPWIQLLEAVRESRWAQARTIIPATVHRDIAAVVDALQMTDDQVK